MSADKASPAGGLAIYPKIDRLRRKLLDLSRANPLIAAKLSPRSNSVVRVVDERPEFLLQSLAKGQRLRFKPLPPLEAEPADEKSEEFLTALAAARLVDEKYLADLMASARKGAQDEGFEVAATMERDLKDRVRQSLGLTPRQAREGLSLALHAKNHGVTPDYDLPPLNGAKPPPEHVDRDVQTLLLPQDLDRKLNALLGKRRLAEEETGVNALKAAFGFLEWRDGTGAECLSPLVLLAVRMTRKLSPRGQEFFVWADDEEGEANFVLAEKARLEFGLALPPLKFDESGTPLLESYFVEVTAAIAEKSDWRVRRQVAFGLFPSSRMAMYEDLGPDRRDYEKLPLLRELLLGGRAEPGLFAPDYEVDRPEIEARVPGLVLDADSSQISTLVDLAQDRPLAVEGPPGAGKSQTIVNAIAAALADRKTVLFVAEKQAALEVVKSRLEAVGLGEFLFPLQAQRSTRQQAVESIRARVGLAPPPPELQAKALSQKFRDVRGKLAEYVDLVGSEHGQTGLSVYEIVGQSLKLAPLLAAAPERFKDPAWLVEAKRLGPGQLKDLIQSAGDLEAALGEAAARPAWRGATLRGSDPFTVDQALSLAQKAALAQAQVGEAAQGLAERLGDGLGGATDGDLAAARVFARRAEELAQGQDQSFLAAVLAGGLTEAVLGFAKLAARLKESEAVAQEALADPTDPANVGILAKLTALGQDHDLETLDPKPLAADLAKTEQGVLKLKLLRDSLSALLPDLPELGQAPMTAFAAAKALLGQAPAPVAALGARLGAGERLMALKDKNRQGQSLLEKRGSLAARLDPDCPLEPKELRAMAETFLSAGFFKFISPTYRRAERAYRAIVKGPADSQMAAGDLTKLAAIKEEARAFEGDQAARAAYGLNFAGLNTDFGLYEAAIAFADRLEAIFPAEKFPMTRLWLLEGRPALLDFLAENDCPAASVDYG
ncbi:MAG: DUF4011 domain-containing protein, partial [Deltaproteobacteria bacterium]|nr:DUF4011 domain-containing protein [Deltaproteobacteria bacterium]